MNPLDARRRLLGRNVYKKTVEGNPAIAQGSLARRYPGIGMQGWTEQASTTGAQLFDYTKSEEGVLNAEGNIETGESYRTSDFIPLDSEKKYIISATGSKRGKYYNSEKKPIRTGGFSDFNPEKGTQIIPNETIAYCRFTYMKESESTIMLNEGSTLKLYEPYTGGAPSPSPDYKQEIKNAGKYDEGTGKYQYEVKLNGNIEKFLNAFTNFQIEISAQKTEYQPYKEQTVTLTSDRPLTKWDSLEKRNGQWGWVYKSAEIETYTDESVPGEYYSTTGQLSVGAQVWYETATETFVPLTTSEQEAMNTLYTFRPTTVLSNDCDCNMSLTYKTKKSMQSAPGGGYKEA